jgi:RNA polymerase sigma-70 factor (ECF subfamily)
MSKKKDDGINKNIPEIDPNEDSLDPDTVRLLIQDLRGGDSEAKSKLASHVQSYLNIMAGNKISPALRAHLNPSDIVQQSLIQMVNGIDNFRGNSSKEFYAWLTQIIRNESNKAARDLTRQKRDVRKQVSMNQVTPNDSWATFETIDPHATPGTEAIANERMELFNRTLESMPEDYAKVIQLRILEQLTFTEIADKLDRSPDSVSKLWYRAVNRFQKEIERTDEQS